MKNFVYSMLAAVVLGFGFVSCSDDDPVINHDQTAPAAAAGTYNGTWTSTNVNETLSGSGSITIAATGDNTVTVTFVDPTNSVEATSPANVTWAAHDIFIQNQLVSDANSIGAAFTIVISADGKVKSSYKKSVKVNRKLIETIFTFDGNK